MESEQKFNTVSGFSKFESSRSWKCISKKNIFDKLPSILYNETTIALVCIMWLSLAQYNSNNILKCIGSYYYGLYLYSKYIIKA